MNYRYIHVSAIIIVIIIERYTFRIPFMCVCVLFYYKERKYHLIALSVWHLCRCIQWLMAATRVQYVCMWRKMNVAVAFRNNAPKH